MPFGDGTGPRGLGPRTGKGRGSGVGRGIGKGRGGGGGNRPGAGPDGNCTCSKCGVVVPHKRGMPCYEHECPECGAPMIRD